MTSSVLTNLGTIAALAMSLAALVLSVTSFRRLDAGRDQVDRRLDRFTRLLDSLDTDASSPTPPEPAHARPRTPVPFRRVDRAEPVVPPGPTLIAIPNLAAAGGSWTSDPEGSELGRRYAAIWQQADAGASADEIAQATGQPIGQVELILGLKRQLTPAGGPRPS